MTGETFTGNSFPMLNLLTTKQAAERLGRTVRQVHYLVQQGDLSPVSRLEGPRGALFFAEAEVDRLAERLIAEAAS